MKYQILCLVAVICFAVGCDNRMTPTPSSFSSSDSVSSATNASHTHATQGPHQGTLIELGSGKYHAELTHDDRSVTIYILDSEAKSTVPINATELIINLVHSGMPEQFKLAASPLNTDPANYSSRYKLESSEFIDELEHDHAQANLSVSIDGKAYRGEIHHDHTSHDHAH